MRKLISAILFSSDVELSKEQRVTLSGKIKDAINSQYNVSNKKPKEPFKNGADIHKDNTAVVRLSMSELWILCNELQNKELAGFFGKLYNKLNDMNTKRQDEEIKQRGADFCEPGVNCE